MKAAEALATIRARAVARRMRFTRHALERMDARHVTEDDIRHVLMNATACAPGQSSEKWDVRGDDLDGEPLKVVVALVVDVLIITVHDG